MYISYTYAKTHHLNQHPKVHHAPYVIHYLRTLITVDVSDVGTYPTKQAQTQTCSCDGSQHKISRHTLACSPCETRACGQASSTLPSESCCKALEGPRNDPRRVANQWCWRLFPAGNITQDPEELRWIMMERACRKATEVRGPLRLRHRRVLPQNDLVQGVSVRADDLVDVLGPYQVAYLAGTMSRFLSSALCLSASRVMSNRQMLPFRMPHPETSFY